MTHPHAAAPVQIDPLTATQWSGVERLLPLPSLRGRPFTDRRSVINGVVWQYLTSCPWRTVPRHYAPWQTCYHYRRELDRLGLWDVIVRTLGLVPQARGRLTTGDPEPGDLPAPDDWAILPE